MLPPGRCISGAQAKGAFATDIQLSYLCFTATRRCGHPVQTATPEIAQPGVVAGGSGSVLDDVFAAQAVPSIPLARAFVSQP